MYSMAEAVRYFAAISAQQGRDGKKDCGFPHRIDFTTMRTTQADLQWNHGVKGRSSLPRDAVVEIGRPAR
jgi:hypothetical protein